MSWINRTMIVPAEHVDLARALAEGISGPAGAGMWTTGLSADGTEPATHYISAGLIESQFADLLPLTVYDSQENATTTSGQAVYVAENAQIQLEIVESLLESVTVTDEDPLITMTRMNLRLISKNNEQ